MYGPFFDRRAARDRIDKSMNTSTRKATGTRPSTSSLSLVRVDGWSENARQVRAHLQKHGSLPEPGGDVLEKHLSEWLDTQRRAMQQNRLKPERASILDRATPGWRRSRDERWTESLTLAASGPRSEISTEWLRRQKRSYRAGTLRADRIAALSAAIPGWQFTGGSSWDADLERLRSWVAEHGTLPAYGSEGAEGELHAWLTRQRQAVSAGRLSAQRAARLHEAAPGWLDALETKWQANARAVAEHLAQTGRLPMVRSTAENKLARWVGTQRAALRAGTLESERRTWLDTNIPGWSGQAAA